MTDATADSRSAPPAVEAGAVGAAPVTPPVTPAVASPVTAMPQRPRRPGAAGKPAGPAGKLRQLAPDPAVTPARPRPVPVPTPVVTTAPARMRFRHYAMIASFVVVVLLPFLATVGYLWWRAAPEYHSETAFSVRSESGGAAAGILGALTQIGGGGSASDVNVLYDFIRSQEIVERIDARLDLRAIYNRAEGDPVFTLGDDPSIEALLGHWRRMVQVDLAASEGIITVHAYAFTPEDAQAITREIVAESDKLVNQLSEKARVDAVRFAKAELAQAEAHLRTVRENMTGFRRDHRMVDPSGDIAGQTGLVNALEGSLAQALVERDMLLSYADERDQRVIQANRRIDAIQKRIEDERGSMQLGGEAGAMPEVLAAYEELRVDLEFASTAYTHTLAGFAAAQAEAQRQSRYLVPHVSPTLATTSLYPRRVMIAGMVGLFLLIGWSVLMLVYYNVRDNG